jgi:hypothetical protein
MRPIVNTGHIAGVALLVGSIILLDLRLVCAWRSVPLAPIWHVLTRTAGVGLAFAIVFGALLFVTRATEYAASSSFMTKTAVVGAGIANALVLGLIASAQRRQMQSANDRPPRRLQIAGGFSLIAWLTALTL